MSDVHQLNVLKESCIYQTEDPDYKLHKPRS